MDPAPRVYVRLSPVPPLRPIARLVAIALCAACFGVLWVGYLLTPNAKGVGTHTQLGMAPCGFVSIFGLPCPSCGYTTSFSLFSHGRVLASALNQPAGFGLAVLAAMTGWVSLYVAVTGKPVHRLFARYASPGTILQGGALIFLAWGYKIVMFKMGR